MSYKTATKPKKKPLYASVGIFKKKTGPMKIFETGKGYKSATIATIQSGKGYKPVTATALGAGNVYGATKMHQLGHGVSVMNPITPEQALLISPEEQESNLADKLITEIADHSADVNALCEDYQLKREELGRLTGFSLRALAEWASGKLPSQPAKRRLQEVRRLLDALAEVVKPESIPKWLHQPNPAFERLTPLQVIELGEIDRLWAMVHDMASGQLE